MNITQIYARTKTEKLIDKMINDIKQRFPNPEIKKTRNCKTYIIFTLNYCQILYNKSDYNVTTD